METATAPNSAPETAFATEDLRPLGCQSHRQLAVKRIGPGEPRPRKHLRIVLLEGLMHKAGAGGGVAQPAKALPDFRIIGGSERAHDDRHGPDHIQPSMRTAHTLRRCAAEEIRISFAQHKLPGATIERIIDSATAE